MKTSNIRGKVQGGRLILSEGWLPMRDGDVIVTIRHMKDVYLNIDLIINAVSDTEGIPINYIVGKSRKKEYVFARYIIAYLATFHTSFPLATIGNLLGKRNHTTILHGKKAVADQLDIEKKLTFKPYTTSVKKAEIRFRELLSLSAGEDVKYPDLSEIIDTQINNRLKSLINA